MHMATGRPASWIARIAITSLVVASCRGASTGSLPPGSSATPATPASVSPSEIAQQCPNFVEHVDTGPQPTDFSETGPLAVAQARLQHDIEAAQEYGNAHRNEFASIRFENAPRVRIVIGFTGHVAEHCAALRSALEHPAEFEIIRQALPEARLLELMEEISARAGQHLLSIALTADHLDMTLRPDGKAIADELTAVYGDVLRVTAIGFLGYPDPSIGARPCQTLLATKIDTSALRATLILDEATIRSGEDFRGSVVIRNSGAGPLELNSGDPATAVIYRAGTNELVGGYAAGGEGVGLGGTMAPGAEITASMVSGTASCVPELGYTLPPGTYDARAVVEQYQPLAAGGIVITDLLSPPVPFVISP